ncbi:MAG: DNA-3-methyladenine glycosylase 2 family protein [Pseudomonadota bacterium]
MKLDIQAAETFLSKTDPVMKRLIKAHGPCTLGQKKRDPFHVLCGSIISQQLSTKAADTIAKRVEARVGAKSRFRPTHFHAVTQPELRACGLSNAKASWLKELARRVDAGEFSFAKLLRLDDEAAIEMLDALPGIGRWTAEMYLMFALGRADLFAMDDVGLRRGVNQCYGKGKKLSDTKTLAISKTWAPYRSVASWYLWRSIEGEIIVW